MLSRLARRSTRAPAAGRMLFAPRFVRAKRAGNVAQNSTAAAADGAAEGGSVFRTAGGIVVGTGVSLLSQFNAGTPWVLSLGLGVAAGRFVAPRAR